MTVRSREGDVRAVFIAYLLFIAAGLAFCLGIGVMQR